jgi:hypothetical protein
MRWRHDDPSTSLTALVVRVCARRIAADRSGCDDLPRLSRSSSYATLVQHEEAGWADDQQLTAPIFVK